MRLNLGCNDVRVPGHLNVDVVPGPCVDLVCDLRERWPWDDSSVEGVVAHDFVEHLPDKIHTMNELWRVLVPGGTASVRVPTTDYPTAFQDPTHVSFWNRQSFQYYEDGNYMVEHFAGPYGIRARFRVIEDERVDGYGIRLVLRAVKRDEMRGFPEVGET